MENKKAYINKPLVALIIIRLITFLELLLSGALLFIADKTELIEPKRSSLIYMVSSCLMLVVGFVILPLTITLLDGLAGWILIAIGTIQAFKRKAYGWGIYGIIEFVCSLITIGVLVVFAINAFNSAMSV